MDKPTLDDAHRRLHRLAGQWGGEETVHPAPHDPGGPATAFLNNRIALGGKAVIQEYEQYRDGRPTYSGHGVFWFDGAADDYAMTWYDSMLGTALEFRGGFEGDVLRLVHTLPQGGYIRGTFDCGLPGEYVFMMDFSTDGVTWTPTMEGAYGLLNGPTPRERKKRVAHRMQAATAKAPARTGGAGGAGTKKTGVAAGRAAAAKTAGKPGGRAAGRAAARPAAGTRSAAKQPGQAVRTAATKSVARAAKKAARGKK